MVIPLNTAEKRRTPQASGLINILQRQKKEHTDKSAIAEHHCNEHPSEKPNFTFKIVQKGRGFVHRKCAEALHYHDNIKKGRWTINRRAEGSGIANLHI